MDSGLVSLHVKCVQTAGCLEELAYPQRGRPSRISQDPMSKLHKINHMVNTTG